MKNKKFLIILFNIFIIILIGNKINTVYGYSVEVNNFASFKDYMEKPEEVTLTLTGVIQATETVFVRGNKTIYGNDWYINNYLNAISGGSNEILSVQPGATLTLRGCYFNGQNKTTIASSNITIAGGATCNVYNSEIYNGTQGIHVSTNATLNFYSGKLALNSMCGIGAYGAVNFNGGTISDSSQGIHNNGGKLTVNGGTITASTYGLYNKNNGTTILNNGNVYGATHGIYNEGIVTMNNGKIYNTTNGIYNLSGKTVTLTGGEIYNNTNGANNIGTLNIKGGTIHSNSVGITNTGTLNVTSGTIKDNTSENGSAIYQNGTCTITGGTFGENQNVYLAADNRYVSTNSSYSTFTIKPNSYTRGRILVKTTNNDTANEELNYLALVPNGKWQTRASGSNIVIWDKSNVVVSHVDESGNELANSNTIKNWYGENYSTSAETITDYRLKTTPENAIGIHGEEDINVTYVYELNTSTIEIRYVDVISGDVLETIEETGIIGSEYTSEPRDIAGYSLTKEPENKTVNYTPEKIILTYEYKKIAGGVDTIYIDQVTRNEIAEREHQEGLEKDEYITTAKTIPGYILVVTPENSLGEMTEEHITATFEYIKLSNVSIKYVDLNTNNDIIDPIISTLKEGETYVSEAKEIDGYELTQIPENASSTVGNSDITVIYGYKKLSQGVDIKYINQVNGKELYSTIHIDGLEGDSYNSQPKNIEGYELVNSPDNASGTLSVDKIAVSYEYRKLSNIIVKYIDLNNSNSEIADETTQTLKEGDNYITDPIEINGYRIVSTISNARGTLGNSDITVLYGYKKISEGVDVRFIDQSTGEEIETTEHQEGLEKDRYIAEPKDIEGYELVQIPENPTGEMTVEKITVIYEYRKLSNVVVKYIDENTGIEIEDFTIETYKEGDTYKTLPKNKEGYVVTTNPENKEGTVGREDIEVVYGYKKVSEGLVVKYVDMIKDEILDTKEYTGNEGDVITLEEKEIEEYVLVESPEETEITLTPEYKEVTYYYKKKVKTEVIGIDANTNKEIYKDEIDGIEGEEYSATPKEIEGYVLVERPENETIITDRDADSIVYKYKRISKGVTITYIDDYSGELLDEEKYEGLEGDSYSSEIKEYDKYEFVSIEGTPEGKITVDETEVVYHYEKKTGVVEVIYVDEDGKELLMEKLEDKVDNAYKVEEKEVKNYRVKEYPQNLEGIYGLEKQIVTYIMEKIPGKIIINLRDDNGQIIETVEENGFVGEEIEVVLPEIDGYYTDEEKIFKIEFIDGELVKDFTYHLNTVAPDTGDINVVAIIVLSIIFIVGIVYALKQYKKK